MSTEESPAASKQAIVIFGVCGCGKSTIGRLLASRLNSPFLEGDAFHPKANIEKMSANFPLTDGDRIPWLANLGKSLGESARSNGLAIAACSALKKKYRDQLIEAAQMPILFLYMKGSQELIARRMAIRTHHFMPVGLLESQIATLEPPIEDENAIVCPINESPEQIVENALVALKKINLV
jgi:carbohydrate kinase (thermoresistant glucokinase family)